MFATIGFGLPSGDLLLDELGLEVKEALERGKKGLVVFSAIVRVQGLEIMELG